MSDSIKDEIRDAAIVSLRNLLRLAVSHLDLPRLQISHCKDWAALAPFARLPSTKQPMAADAAHAPCLAEPVHGGSFPRCSKYPDCPCGGVKDESSAVYGPNGECPVCGGIDSCKPGCEDGSEIL